MDPKLKVIITFIIPVLLIIVFSIPLIIRKIPRNAIYGFRTTKTMANDDIWYRANRYGGICILVAALVTLAGITILFLNKEALSFEIFNNTSFALFVGPILISVLLSLDYIKKL